jgi:NADH:ubiquinone reductase (H+-translocating)
MTDPHRVVVVGGGFGGLNVVRALAHAEVEVTVVDRTNHHLFQPLLYQVAAGILPPGLIAPALRGVIKKQANARALLAEVTDFDLDRRVVAAFGPDGRPLTLPYDTLVVAAGATHSYFGRDEFARHAPGMKTVENARHLRDQILLAFEMAELATDPAERAEWLTFVVIGAGPTGVELVGQVAELAHKVLPRDYRTVNTREAKILLLEGAGAVLGPFPEKLRAYSQRKLEEMGVEVRLNTLAIDMDGESITVKGPAGQETIRTRTRIWAAGVAASPLAKLLAAKAGLEVDRPGRIPVQPDCTLAGHPEVFAVGDMVSLNNLPGVAQPAMQEGKYVGKLIKARLAGDEKVEPFKYFDKGNMATIGHRSAIADAFGMKFTGILGYTMWGFIHVLYLIGWGNRLGTIYTWARALTFSRSRGHRLITFDEARGLSPAAAAARGGGSPAPDARGGGSAAPDVRGGGSAAPDDARRAGPPAVPDDAREVSPSTAPAGGPPSGPDR